MATATGVKSKRMQYDRILSTGKVQPKQEVDAERVDELTKNGLNREDISHCSLDRFKA